MLNQTSIKKILITGGAGYVGNELIKSLPRNVQVIVIDNFHIDTPEKRQLNAELEKDRDLTLIKANISQAEKFSSHLKDIDVVVHLASLNSYKEANLHPTLYLTENNYNLQILLDVLKTTSPGIQKMLLTSTRGVYGEGPYLCAKCGRRVHPYLSEHLTCPVCAGTKLQADKITESDIPNPASLYGITKRQQEDLVNVHCQLNSIPLDIFRIFNVFGENQGRYYSHIGIIPMLHNQITAKHEVHLSGRGRLTRDFVHVQDVVKVLSASIHSRNTRKSSTEIYNLGSGMGVNISDLASAFTHLGYKFSKKYLSEFNDIKYSVANNSKVKENFNLSEFKSVMQFLTQNYS